MMIDIARVRARPGMDATTAMAAVRLHHELMMTIFLYRAEVQPMCQMCRSSSKPS
jgi:hypothetical protein